MEWKQNHWDEQSKKKSTLHYHLPARILYWVMWLPKFYSPLQISQFRTKITTQQKRSSPDKSKYNPPQYKLWKSIVWQGLLVRKKEMKDKVNHIIFQGFRTRKSFVRPYVFRPQSCFGLQQTSWQRSLDFDGGESENPISLVNSWTRFLHSFCCYNKHNVWKVICWLSNEKEKEYLWDLVMEI